MHKAHRQLSNYTIILVIKHNEGEVGLHGAVIIGQGVREYKKFEKSCFRRSKFTFEAQTLKSIHMLLHMLA